MLAVGAVGLQGNAGTLSQINHIDAGFALETG